MSLGFGASESQHIPLPNRLPLSKCHSFRFALARHSNAQHAFWLFGRAKMRPRAFILRQHLCITGLLAINFYLGERVSALVWVESFMSIQRRSVLKGLPIMGAAALSSPSIAQGKRTLTAATAFPVAAEGPGAAARRFAKTIETASDGALHIEVVDRSGGGAALYDAASQGDIDMCFGAEEMWRGRNPAYALFSSPPSGMTPNEFESWIKWGGGQDVWAALSAEAGLTPYLVGDSGPSHTLLAQPSLSIAGLAGASVQTTGLTSELWSLLGASAITDSYADGTLAAADIYNGEDAIGALRANFGHYTARLSTPLNRVNNAISLNINTAALDALNDDQKMMLDLAANREHMAQRVDATIMSHRTTEIILGLTPVETPADLIASHSIAINTMLGDISAFDAKAADAVWSLQLHQEDVAEWSAIGEGAYLGARNAAEAAQ